MPDGSGWRLVFQINLPLGIQAIVGSTALLPTTRGGRHARSLDLGGAHRLPKEAVEQLGAAIDEALRPLLSLDDTALRSHRREKFLAMGLRGL